MPAFPLPSALRTVALVAGLVLGCVAPEASTTLTIVAAVAGFGVLRRRHGALLARPAVWMPLAAGLLLAATYAIGSGSAVGAVAIYFFIPLFLIAPLLALLDIETNENDNLIMASLALIGVAGACVVALNDRLVLGEVRSGFSVANPIHFADLALGVGFLALVGFVLTQRWWRVLFLFGPLLSLVTIWLSGSRGPQAAFLVMIATSIGFLVFWGGLSRRLTLLVALGAVALLVAVLAIGINSPTGPLQVIADIWQPLINGTTDDASTGERLVMYQSAWNAFMAAPIFGHGLLDLVPITANYVPAGEVFPAYEHLHSDLADFAVSGGILGIAGYAMLVLAPLVEALRAPDGPNRRPAILAATLLSVGFVSMGLTNAMFGIILLTVFFAFATAMVSRLAHS
ncbi:O-antigen ligase family protein [Devosia algicola]|uniref:O-antigen ligase family protein n=1 Tax=Devosia algicola TaxID=3026418 RepID=A0ABY7YL77_9HYPH|nr:O-antigen ligase family protein [Devosia algicola]WDR02013.1 O-antigen ligase family protein [Devosia algicola]